MMCQFHGKSEIMKLSPLRFSALFAGFYAPLATLLSATLLSAAAHAETVGSVDTAFKLIGPDHKVVVEAYDDPKVNGVTCDVSRAKTGGISGGLGLAEDKAEASIACRQVGPISFTGPLKQQEEVFNQSLSILFKKLRIVRMVDQKRSALVYLTYSDKLIDGSPKNSVTAVPVDHSTPIPMK
jgi:CreA protein